MARALDAFLADQVAGGTSEVDAKNAFGSIWRDAIQRGIIKLAPELFCSFNFLYGNGVMGHCYLYGRGQATPLSSCPIPCGVQQGDVFGPIFFALGLDELLVAIRERMRNLPVDSTFIEQRVFVSELVLGTLVDGDHRSAVPLQVEMPLTLVGAPSYADIEAAADMSSPRVVVRVGEGESSYRVEVAWSVVRFGAEILLAAFLDDIHFPGTRIPPAPVYVGPS